MIGPDNPETGLGDEAWRDPAADEALLNALPEELRHWVDLQLATSAGAAGEQPAAEVVRRYLVALVRITTLTCPNVTKQAAAEALGMHFTPDPTASLVSDNDIAAIVQASADCQGLN